MFSLSNAQAAATLAAIVVGLRVGLIDELVVNAVVIVILVTCLVSSAAATHYATRLPVPQRKRSFGEAVVVPLANPETAPRLTRLASSFARADGGVVIPVIVAPSESDAGSLERLRDLEGDVLEIAQSAGAEARPVLRIDDTPQKGIAHSVVEQRASLLVLGWNGATTRLGAMFGGIIDGVLEQTRVPTLLTYEGHSPPKRILVVLDESVTTPRGRAPLLLALNTALHVQRDLRVRVHVIANLEDTALRDLVREHLNDELEVDLRRRSILVKEHGTATDLVILPTLSDDTHLRDVTGRVLRAVPEGASLVVAVAELSPVDTPSIEWSPPTEARRPTMP